MAITYMFRLRCDSLIFDLDGTLWDASATSAKAWSEVLGTEVTVEQLRSITGLPFDECVKRLFGEGRNEIQLAQLLEELNVAEKAWVEKEGGQIYPGVKENLKQLSLLQPLFLVSNCTDWYLECFWQHSGLRELFRDALCHGHTGRPKSENIKSLSAKHGLKRALYVGDTHWDQEAAIKAGAQYIHVNYGFGAPTESCPRLNSLAELTPILLDVKTNS